VASTTTGTNGSYQFTGVIPGTYTVRLGTTTGYYLTQQDVGSDDTIDSDFDPTMRTVTLALTSGHNVSDVDAGLYTLATVQGKAWVDADTNGIRSPSEQSLAGVQVTLLTADGTAVEGTTTDSSGNYSFSAVAPGSYYLQFEGPISQVYLLTAQDQGGDDTADSDVDSSGLTASFTLSAGQTKSHVDAGLYMGSILP